TSPAPRCPASTSPRVCAGSWRCGRSRCGPRRPAERPMRGMSEQLVRRLSAAPGLRTPMPTALRPIVCAPRALLWPSGVTWLVPLLLCAPPNGGGTVRNAGEAPLMSVRGPLGVAGVFLLGCPATTPAGARWWAYRSRPSGLALLATAAVLVASGYALYYSTG